MNTHFQVFGTLISLAEKLRVKFYVKCDSSIHQNPVGANVGSK